MSLRDRVSASFDLLSSGISRKFYATALCMLLGSRAVENNDMVVSHAPTSSVSPSSPSFSLDDIAPMDKSILYYHIAKDKDGTFDIREKCERVLAMRHRIYEADRMDSIPRDIRDIHVGLIFCESGGDSTVSSCANAKGIGQFMPETGKDYGLGDSVISQKIGTKTIKTLLNDKRCDVTLSLRASAKLLHNLYMSFGDRSLAIAAYHMGHGNMTQLRNLYKNTMSEELHSMHQLYTKVSSTEVRNFLTDLDDDSFGYYIKICNGVTLLRIYQHNRPLFDSLEQQYSALPYDARGIVAENICFRPDAYMNDSTIACAIKDALLAPITHATFVGKKDKFSRYLHVDALHVLSAIKDSCRFPISISSGLLSKDKITYELPRPKDPTFLRLASHATGKAFDITVPHNKDNKNRLEYALTLLRYQGKILWCREGEPKNPSSYHVVVL